MIYFDDRYFLFDGRYILLCGEGLFQFWEGTGGSKTGINALYHKIKKQAEQLTKVVMNILKLFLQISKLNVCHAPASGFGGFYSICRKVFKTKYKSWNNMESRKQ